MNSSNQPMKFLKYLLFLLLIAVIGMSIYVAVQPNSFQVKESILIKAPKQVIFKAVSDTTSIDLSGFWKATETLKTNSNIPSDSIQQTFTSPRIKNSQLAWSFESDADGSTKVSRTLIAERLSFFTKAKVALFGNEEDEISTQFKEDLKNLESRVIKSMEVYTIDVKGVTQYGGGFYMYKTTSSTGNNKRNATAEQLQEIMSFMNTHNITSSGMPFTIYIEMNMENGNVIMSNAIPVSEKINVAEESAVLSGYMERTDAVKVILHGDYKNQKEAWAKARKYLKDNNLEASEMSPFEVYINDVANIPNPADWVTEIYIPILPKMEDL